MVPSALLSTAVGMMLQMSTRNINEYLGFQVTTFDGEVRTTSGWASGIPWNFVGPTQPKQLKMLTVHQLRRCHTTAEVLVKKKKNEVKFSEKNHAHENQCSGSKRLQVHLPNKCRIARPKHWHSSCKRTRTRTHLSIDAIHRQWVYVDPELRAQRATDRRKGALTTEAEKKSTLGYH